MAIKIRCVGYASRTFWKFDSEKGTQCVPYIYARLADAF